MCHCAKAQTQFCKTSEDIKRASPESGGLSQNAYAREASSPLTPDSGEIGLSVPGGSGQRKAHTRVSRCEVPLQASGSSVREPAHRRDDHTCTRLERIDDLAATDVDTDVADARGLGVREHQVARPQLGLADAL